MENTRFENFINEMSAKQTTTLQEGAHAIAFGIRQLLGKNIIQEDLLNEDLFYKSYRRFADIDVSPEEIFKWLNEQPTWVSSIIKATNAFFKSGYAKRNGYVFYRGVNFMNRVYQEFNKIQKCLIIKI